MDATQVAREYFTKRIMVWTDSQQKRTVYILTQTKGSPHIDEQNLTTCYNMITTINIALSHRFQSVA